MSSEGDDIPDELLWRGDVDDGSADLFFLGDDDLDDDLGGGSNLVMRKGTDYSIGVDNDDDPLGGLKILGSIHDSLEDEEEEEPSPRNIEEEDGEEDFVKILEDSIQRDLPKYVFHLHRKSVGYM